MRRLETILLAIYFSLVTGIYIAGKIFLEIYTSVSSSAIAWCFAGVLLPVSVYAAFRVSSLKENKWYTYIFNFLLLYGMFMFTGYFTWMKANLLVSAMMRPNTEQTVPIYKVEKIFLRKHGFDRTNVTIGYLHHKIVFEGSRTCYFLLQHKKSITIKIGTSYTNNYYVTKFYLPASERWLARWNYLKDWFSRMWWIGAFFTVVFLFMWVKQKYWPDKPGIKPKPLPLWRLMLIVFISVIAIGALILLGLYVYIKFIA